MAPAEEKQQKEIQKENGKGKRKTKTEAFYAVYFGITNEFSC